MKLTLAELNHLYWRTAFGPRPEDLHPDRLVSRQAAVDRLFAESATWKPWEPAIPTYKLLLKGGLAAEKKLPAAERKRRQQARKAELVRLEMDWFEQMSASPTRLRERLTLFWHSHFANRQPSPNLAVRYVNSLRRHAMGKFGDLLAAMTHDAALLRSLNSQQNKKSHPNENFARELLELFTIGRGHYTEQDIREGARAFTGWQTNADTGEFTFDARVHDAGQKTFMGQTGPWTGDDISRIILQQPQTAVFLTTKLYRWFVSDTPDPARIAPLAQSFRESDYDIGGLVRQMLLADWFYEPAVRGARIKAPLELLIGMRNLVKADFPTEKGWAVTQRTLGQQLFYPPNVAGWPGGRAWIDSATLVFRLKLPQALFREAELDIVAKDDNDAMPNMGKEATAYAIGGSPTVDLAALRALVVAHGLDPDAPDAARLATMLLNAPPRPALLEVLKRVPPGPEALRQLTVRLLSVPEYQLG